MRVLVTPNLYTRAFAGEPLRGRSASHWFTERRTLPLLRSLPLPEALTTRSAPALFTAYAPPGEESTLPRLSKAAGPHYRSLPEEMRPRLECLIVDIDTPGHVVPEPEWHVDILSRLRAPFDRPMWYRTPHGLRLCYELAESIDITLAQSWLTQAYEALRDLGIPVDAGTEDWTRLFRFPDREADLPRQLDAQPPLSFTPPRPLEVEAAVSLGRVVASARPAAARDKLTRKELKPVEKLNERLADQLYTNRLTSSVGDRHRTLLSAALTIARAYESNDPSIPYELLLRSALTMGKDPDELWSICNWAAAAQDGYVSLLAAEAQQALLKASADMRCRPAEVSKRLIIDTGSEQFVWDEAEGRYSMGYTNQHQLLPALDRHCPGLIPEYYTTFADPIRNHSSHAEKLVYSYDPKHSGYDPHTRTMYVLRCQPDPTIRPVRSQEVEEWLQGTFGASPHYERLLDWLARSRDLSAPVCALYIEGGPGTGKNLLARGLARTWNPEGALVDYAKLLGDFNQPLLDSPLIVADEKVPTDKRGANESAVFRRAIGNDAFRINAKFRTEATLLGYPRTMILANNMEALRINEDLGEDDLEAIRIRIGYIRIPDEAEGFLSDMARRRGYPTVRSMVDRWVSEGTIAAHIYWLSENREVKEGDRFLVEGWESELTETLPSTVGSSGLIAESVANAVASGHFYASVRWFEGSVFVSNALLARDWEDLMPGERLPSNASRLKALKSLSRGTRRTLDLPGVGRRVQKQYWELPAAMVARIAEERGCAPAKDILQAAARTVEDRGAFVAIEKNDTILA